MFTIGDSCGALASILGSIPKVLKRPQTDILESEFTVRPVSPSLIRSHWIPASAK